MLKISTSNPEQISKKYFNLLIAFSGPYGSGCSSLSEELERVINDWPGCLTKTIKVSDLISNYYMQIFGESVIKNEKNTWKRRQAYQNAGTKLRSLLGDDFLAKAIAAKIYEAGLEFERSKSFDRVNCAVFLIDSLKNLSEVHCLRKNYKDEFYFLYVHANRDTRWERMVQYKSWSKEDRVSFETRDLVDQDEKIINDKVKTHGQQVGKLSSEADYYIVNDKNREVLQSEGKRFLELLFGNSKNQPTKHERCMHLAFSASNRSFCISRQVGAAIFDSDGNLIGLGHNDVPKAHGGLYTQDDYPDKRCYLVGDRRCTNDTQKQERFDALAEQIKDEKRLKLNDKQLDVIKKLIEKSQFREATEYCRAVHAEMEALLSVARSNTGATKGAILYVTTEPCHNCTKHIICAGVTNVIFIEPYPKSLASELHADAMDLTSPESQPKNEKVKFLHYYGLAPNRYHDFFTITEEIKEKETGKYKVKSKEDQSNSPRFAVRIGKRTREIETDKTKIDYRDTTTLFELFCQLEMIKIVTTNQKLPSRHRIKNRTTKDRKNANKPN